MELRGAKLGGKPAANRVKIKGGGHCREGRRRTEVTQAAASSHPFWPKEVKFSVEMALALGKM